jgi:hypothetical protein
MRTNKQKDISFIIGTYDKKRQKGKQLYRLLRKSQVEHRANLLLHENGYVWLKIVYGKGKDVWGQTAQIYNDGVYTTMKDLKFAFAAFIEQGNIDYLTGDIN